ncbi:MAG: hypothetical protein U0269_06785 [Polyangiales bacterium]
MNVRSLLLCSALALVACSPPPAPTPDASDSGSARTDAPSSDATSGEDGSTAMDAAASDGASGAVCSFNRECPASERCECDERNGCRCLTGARGTGAFGQPCSSGNDCASALCVEGPNAGQSLCSDECTGPAQCSGMLPRCVNVPTVGMFCARNPPDGGVMEAGAPTDASITTDAGSCSGACATTMLTATFGANSGPFDRAQHGVEPSGNVYIEAHFGGSPLCPTMTSPTPDRTLVIANVMPTMAEQTYATGVRATLLDFRSTFTTTLPLRATDVRITPRFVSPGAAVSYTFSATFAGGTISGSFFAPHCASLDG